MTRYVCPECGQDHIARSKRDQATPHYRRGDPETGCVWIGVIVAVVLVVLLFLLAAIVPAFVRWALELTGRIGAL